ncbi:MAG: PD-(D/E)XK nuclease family protein, partial [Bacteroidales bacterium]|nr:PD-(D/E)XK nuclease family protein [Bacteroidales bacterium]
DIDKYLVNPALLFRNIKDVKEIEHQFGSLTEEQIDIIRKFWVNFNPNKNTQEKEEFLRVWSVLNAVYSEFNIALRAKGLAYEGMIFREAAENIISGKYPTMKWEMFHFAGFNALNRCEQILMKHLKAEGKARFYWDYDNCYIFSGKFPSAGIFLRENIKVFGNDMPEGWQYNTLLSSETKALSRKVINTSSDVAQAKLIPTILNSFPEIRSEDAHHTAVILADENLLPAVLTSIPENHNEFNITMGFPLKFSGVYSFINLILNLHRNRRILDDKIYFHHSDILKILKSDLIAPLAEEEFKEINDQIVNQNILWFPADFQVKSEIAKLILKKIKTPSELNRYLTDILLLVVSSTGVDRKSEDNRQRVRNELIYRVILSLNRLNTILESAEIDFSLETYLRIVDANLRSISVPFSGEPLKGIQIMGILETRALDFKNIMVLSVNEGILPSPITGASFIPYNLRTSFGMPDINHQEAIYAYHFYRLLHRAENAVFLYNSNSEGLRAGEMSRFLLQLKYDENLAPEFFFHDFMIRTRCSVSQEVERTDEQNRKLISLYDSASRNSLLTPTAINTWLNCSMQFYYRYVCNLREKDELLPEIDHALLGDMLHEIMQRIYKGFERRIIYSDEIDRIRGNRKVLGRLIEDVLVEKFTSMPDDLTGGGELIAREILYEYINKILEFDRLVSPFTIAGLEEYSDFILKFDSNDASFNIRTGGKIDRIDQVPSVTRIVDYKTGKISEKISSVPSLFEEDRDKDGDAWLQTLLYCEAYLVSHPGVRVRPSVYRIRSSVRGEQDDMLLIKEGRDPGIYLDDYGTIRNEFVSLLTETVNKMLFSKEPFRMTQKIEKCSYCPYAGLCMRKY